MLIPLESNPSPLHLKLVTPPLVIQLVAPLEIIPSLFLAAPLMEIEIDLKKMALATSADSPRIGWLAARG